MPADPATACPAEEILGRFIDGALTPTELAHVERHLAHCDPCCAVVAAVPDADVAASPTLGGGEAHRDPKSRLGRYILLERVGVGGMGAVWSAYDPELDRRVAIKLLHWGSGDSDTRESRDRLVNEARAMARVAHPNVVAVHDVVDAGERMLMVMELVTGVTAKAWLAERAAGWREIVELFVAAGRGLAAAHEQGVVHRDFKPDNVLVGHDGRVRVGDFGLASSVGGPMPDLIATFRGDPKDTVAARTAGFVGTPAYMAAEQYGNGTVEARTDQFAFCVSLWEALFGTRPFAGETVTELAAAVLAGELRDPVDRRGVPTRVIRALRRGLAREPTQRHPHIGDLIAELDRATRRRQAGYWVVAAAALAVSVVAAVGGRPPADPCATKPTWLVDAWSADQAETLRAAGGQRDEATADLAGRLADELDTRVEAMTATFAASCRAVHVEHTLPAREHDLRLACLRRAAATVEGVAEYVREADHGRLARALRSGLGAAPNCDEDERTRAELPWVGVAADPERAGALATEVRRATTARRLGEFAPARVHLQGPLAAAGEPGLDAIVAEALYEQALLDQREGDESGMQDALNAAAEAGADAVVFDTLNQLVFEAGVRRGDLGAAQAYAELALAFVGPSGRGDEARGAVYLSLAQGRERMGDADRAREDLERARTLFEAAGAVNEPSRFPMWLAQGVLEERAGRLAAAEERYEHARATLEARLGPHHPDLAVALEYLAIVRRKRGRFEAALEAAQQCLALRRRVLRPEHAETGTALRELGTVLIELGRYAEAETAVREAIAIHEAAGMQRHVVAEMSLLAEIVRGGGDVDAALALTRGAIDRADASLGAEHTDLALLLLRLAETQMERGAAQEAVPSLERALQLAEGTDDVVTRARIALALARALLASGGDRARATALAAQAQSDAAAAPEFASSSKVLAEVPAVLRTAG